MDELEVLLEELLVVLVWGLFEVLEELEVLEVLFVLGFFEVLLEDAGSSTPIGELLNLLLPLMAEIIAQATKTSTTMTIKQVMAAMTALRR